MKFQPHHLVLFASLVCGCGAPTVNKHAGHNSTPTATTVTQTKAAAFVRDNPTGPSLQANEASAAAPGSAPKTTARIAATPALANRRPIRV